MSCSYNLPPRRSVKNCFSWPRSAGQPAGARAVHAYPTDRGDLVMKRLSLLSVYVKDQDAAIEFYTQKLGFIVAEDVPFGPQRWVTLRLPADQVGSLTLTPPGPDEERALVGKQGGSAPLFGIETDDCLREYRRMKEGGVKFHGEPQVQPYGTGVTLEDLYGNKIYMNQEPA